MDVHRPPVDERGDQVAFQLLGDQDDDENPYGGREGIGEGDQNAWHRADNGADIGNHVHGADKNRQQQRIRQVYDQKADVAESAERKAADDPPDDELAEHLVDGVEDFDGIAAVFGRREPDERRIAFPVFLQHIVEEDRHRADDEEHCSHDRYGTLEISGSVVDELLQIGRHLGRQIKLLQAEACDALLLQVVDLVLNGGSQGGQVVQEFLCLGLQRRPYEHNQQSEDGEDQDEQQQHGQPLGQVPLVELGDERPEQVIEEEGHDKRQQEHVECKQHRTIDEVQLGHQVQDEQHENDADADLIKTSDFHPADPH
ncbi:hypothetical protein BN871_AJ_00700 [Paenibacillus sp. P22]|nr:hypothetical protein BN871_AJ_00700 [Paenibacillus sp. P22]